MTPGVEINFKKSHGISLLSPKEIPSEFEKTKQHFDFLGYKLSVGMASINDKSVRRIKKQISYILYKNLLQPLKKPQLTNIVIPNNDQDPAFLSAIMEIRRYLYGNLSEAQLVGYLKGYYRRLKFKGIMSFYPLVDDEEQLKQLDGWLLATIHRALHLRANLLAQKGYNLFTKFPFNQTQNGLLASCKTIEIYNKRLLEIPSFLRIYKAIQKGLSSEGIVKIINPNSDQYGY